MKRFSAVPTAGPAPGVSITRKANCIASLCFGGYTASTNTYSSAAGERILPHILGPLSPLHRQHTHFSELARECQLFVAFGGLPLRNAQVNGGGANDHMLKYWLEKMQEQGTRFINISPVRNDLSAVESAEWLAVRPGTDTALLLALCYVLITESLYDSAFVASHTVGFAPYRAYLMGSAMASQKRRNGPRR